MLSLVDRDRYTVARVERGGGIWSWLQAQRSWVLGCRAESRLRVPNPLEVPLLRTALFLQGRAGCQYVSQSAKALPSLEELASQESNRDPPTFLFPY